jgi:hypothetical protein
MIRHKLPNKTKNATVAESKLFHQLNKPKQLLLTKVGASRQKHVVVMLWGGGGLLCKASENTEEGREMSCTKP